MNNDISTLQARVEKLEALINTLVQTTNIPRDYETALTERLSNSFLNATALGTAATQNILINSTPTTITVPAQPTGTLSVIYKGVVYPLLYKL